MTRIMLIEDDLTMLSLLETLLELEGFTVLHPANDDPQTVMAALRQEKPDVALMDVHLRQFNGLEMLNKMHDDPEAQGIRFIISSGMDFRQESLKGGAAAFILKPYMPDDLIAAINKVSTAKTGV